jgi:predicted nicotinamide N-methyase
MTAAVRVKNFTIQEYEIKSICRAAPPECEGAFPVERSERNLLRPRAEQSMEETLLTKITKQLGELGATTEDTVGWDVWEGATLLLCEYLVQHKELVRGKRVLEIGAGVGIVALVAAMCGAESVVISDYDEGVLLIADANIQLNNMHNVCRTAKYDWANDTAPKVPGAPAAWDVVLGSDLLYSGKMAEKLSGAVRHIFATCTPSHFLLSHQLRFSVTWGPNRTPLLETSDTVLETFVALCSGSVHVAAVQACRESGEKKDMDAEHAQGDVHLYALSICEE